MIENLLASFPVARQPALRLELDLLDRALEKVHVWPEDLVLARQPDLQGLGGAFRLIGITLKPNEVFMSVQFFRPPKKAPK